MENETEEDVTGGEINLLDYVIVLAKRKNLIIIITLSATILSAGYSLILPEMYKTGVTIIGPEGMSARSGLIGELTGLVGLSGGSGNNLNNPMIITAIIQSRVVYDQIIDKFGLMELYGTSNREDTQDILEGSVDVQAKLTNNTLTISVSDEDPQRAADMANAFVVFSNARLQELSNIRNAQKRVFFEKELVKIKEALIASEESMKEFQEKTGMIKVEDQAKAVFKGIADLRAEIAAKEVALMAMKSYSTPNNPELQILQAELKALREEIKKLESKEKTEPDTLLTISNLPSVGTDYIRKLRELRFNEKLFEIMAQQYEMAKMTEANPTILQVLNEAYVPLNRYSPKRKKMVLSAAVTAFTMSIFIVFLIEYISKLQASEQQIEKINRLKKHLSFRSGS